VNARYQSRHRISRTERASTCVCLGAWPIEYHTEPGQPTVWAMVHENSTYDNSLEDAVQQSTPNCLWEAVNGW